MNNLNKIYLDSFIEKKISNKPISFNKDKVRFENLENPNSFKEFLSVNVSDVDNYYSAKFSIEQFANRVSRLVQENLIKAFNLIKDSVENPSLSPIEEGEYVLSSQIINEAIVEVTLSSFANFQDGILDVVNNENALEQYSNSEGVLHIK